MEVFGTYINYSPFLCLRWKWSNGWAHISIWASFTLPFNGSHFGEWKPDITKMCTRSHTLPRHTYNIDSEGIPSSSLIQTSADGALDWMEKVRRKGAMRCAGERAQGLMGGEREGHHSISFFPSKSFLMKRNVCFLVNSTNDFPGICINHLIQPKVYKSNNEASLSMFLVDSGNILFCLPAGMTTERCCTTPPSVWYPAEGA